MVRKCVQCGEKFELSGAEIDHYKEKGLEIPVRCRSCRRSERIRKYDAVAPRGRERRKNRKAVMRRVPASYFGAFVIIAFLLITFTRGGSGTDSPNNPVPQSTQQTAPSNVQAAVLFRSEELLNDHYEKHGKDMGYESAEEYLAGANAAINNTTALHKTEKEDGDDVYYVESTNDFVVVSTDGYIRTYFRPEDGRAYYERQ